MFNKAMAALFLPALSLGLAAGVSRVSPLIISRLTPAARPPNAVQRSQVMRRARKCWFAALVGGATALLGSTWAVAQEPPVSDRMEPPRAAKLQSHREPTESRSLSDRMRSLFGRGKARNAESLKIEPAQTRLDSIPSGLKPDVPSGLKPDVPSGLKPDVPSGLKPDVPSGLKPDVPSGLKPDVQQVGVTLAAPQPSTQDPRHSSGPQPSTLSPPPSSITDEEIARFEDLAFANNPTLAQSRHVVDAAVGRLIQAGRYPNPTLGYVATEVGNDGRAGQQGVVIAQEIVRGGKLLLSQAVASYARDQAEAQAAVQVWRLRNTVRSLYFEILAVQQTKSLSDELLALAEQGVSIAQQREKAGEGTLIETLQAQIELDQVQILAASSKNNLRASGKRLAAVLGQPEREPETLRGSLEAARKERDEAQTLARVSGQSPEVQVAEAGIRRADAAVARARAEPIPNVSLEASTQYDYGSNDQIAGIGISLPLPIWNRNEGNILAAEAELRRSQREVDRVKLSLADRFAATYARFRNAQQQVDRYGRRLTDDEVKRILLLAGEERQKELEKYAQILPRAQIALALATEGWRRGEFGYLQVLTAQRTLAQASLGGVRAQAELRQSAVVLDGYLLTDGLGDPGGGGSGSGQSGGSDQ